MKRPALLAPSVAVTVGALVFGAVSPSMAEPIQGEQPVSLPEKAGDPTSRWTLAALSPPATAGSWQALNVDLTPPKPPSWSPFAPIVGPSDGNEASDPTPYAVLGGALIAAGLLGRRWRRRQRGLS